MSRRRAERITVRVSPETLKLLRARARASRISVAEVVRGLIEAELPPRTALSAMDLSREWVGALNDPNIRQGN